MKYSIGILEAELKKQESSMKDSEENNLLTDYKIEAKRVEDLSHSIAVLNTDSSSKEENYCMPDNINSKEEYEQYLIDIGVTKKESVHGVYCNYDDEILISVHKTGVGAEKNKKAQTDYDQRYYYVDTVVLHA